MVTQKTEALRGNEHIQQLMEEFPDLPRQQVIKADYRVEGLRHTAVLDEIGRWALPDTHDHYEQDYDEHGPEDLVGGMTHTPAQMHFGEVRGLFLALDSRSPYEVKYEGGGRYWLYRDGDPVEEVYFLPCPPWFWKTTSSGTPINQVIVPGIERLFGLCVTTYCEYFKNGNQCRFCNLNTTGDRFAELGQQRRLVKRDQDVYDAFLTCAQEGGIEDINLVGGGFLNRSKEADLYIRFLEVLKRAMRDSGCQVGSVRINSQVMEEQDQRRLKEAGVTHVRHNLEVWDPKLFETICPGKAKNVGQERWIESLLRAVEVFGWGRVVTNLVLGVETIHPFGFKTEEAASESMLEGFQFLASQGVSLELDVFQPRPGAVLAQAPRPRIKYLLRMELERHKLQKEYGLVDRYPYSLVARQPC